MVLGVIGAGAMGSGIAQVAAQSGWDVKVYDLSKEQLSKSEQALEQTAKKLVEKGKWDSDDAAKILARVRYEDSYEPMSACDLIIEAIVENLEVKKKVFTELEAHVRPDCILASNTSSLSIASIAGALKLPARALGIHFFNPAPVMPLVEIIPSVQTAPETTARAEKWIADWKKVGVIAKDTPGFIVNRVARPFYSESIRIYEEGWASFAEIDAALKKYGRFRMGPFELMDFIGNDVNYAVTESVFHAFYFDPRYRPSFTQKRHVEAGWLGRKSGRGYYSYGSEPREEVVVDGARGEQIMRRVVLMLMNEAIDAVFWNVASPKDIDLAMKRGVNYPKGLLAWADEWGLEDVLRGLEQLQAEYGEDRYRPSPLLRKMVREGARFFPVED